MYFLSVLCCTRETNVAIGSHEIHRVFLQAPRSIPRQSFSVVS